MTKISLYRIKKDRASEICRSSLSLEKSLQNLIEENLEIFLGVRLLASEFRTDKSHGGRMDTLGLDENGCPVVIEYKLSSSMNAIVQGLYYLDWLVTHKGDFQMQVLKQFGKEEADSLDWSSPRLICIAGDFSKYDEYAIKQMNRNIDLVRYVKFEDDLLLLEAVNGASVSNSTAEGQVRPSGKPKWTTVSQALEKADQDLKDLYLALKDQLNGISDDVQCKVLMYYIAFKRVKNFACVELRSKERKFLVHVKVDPDNMPNSMKCEEGFTKDVRQIGHFGTGDLEISIRSLDDIRRAMPLFRQSYENA